VGNFWEILGCRIDKHNKTGHYRGQQNDLHTVGVAGSSPAAPTNSKALYLQGFLYFLGGQK